VRWVSCFTSPVALDQRKICCWPGVSVLVVQVEKKASVALSGDQVGELLEQSVAPAGGGIRVDRRGHVEGCDLALLERPGHERSVRREGYSAGLGELLRATR
jgi:hypothetical protein